MGKINMHLLLCFLGLSFNLSQTCFASIQEENCSFQNEGQNRAVSSFSQEKQNKALTLMQLEEIAPQAAQGNLEARSQVLEFFKDRFDKGVFWFVKGETQIVDKLNLQEWALSLYNPILCSLFIYKGTTKRDWIIPQEIINHLKEQSKKNDPYALNNLGYMYYWDIEGEKNNEKAESLLRASSSQNCAEAKFNLALLLREIHGKVTEESLELLSQASLLNHGKAQCILGNMLLKQGKIQESLELIIKSAGNGLALAQLLLGNYYKEGKYLDQDDAKAINNYCLAAEQGLASAQFNLAGLLSKTGQTEKDAIAVTQWMLRAGEQGYKKAYLFLGIIYQAGVGVPINLEQAFYWHKLGAKENGEPACCFAIASSYAIGKGVQANYDKALKWMLKSAKKGDVHSNNLIEAWFPLHQDGSHESHFPSQNPLNLKYKFISSLAERLLSKNEKSSVAHLLQPYCLKISTFEQEWHDALNSLFTPGVLINSRSVSNRELSTNHRGKRLSFQEYLVGGRVYLSLGHEAVNKSLVLVNFFKEKDEALKVARESVFLLIFPPIIPPDLG